MKLKENDTIKEALLFALKEKNPILVLLKSGKEYTGIMKIVGLHCVSLEQKGKRSFFDAIIRIEDISAIEVKVRGT